MPGIGGLGLGSADLELDAWSWRPGAGGLDSCLGARGWMPRAFSLKSPAFSFMPSSINLKPQPFSLQIRGLKMGAQGWKPETGSPMLDD